MEKAGCKSLTGLFPAGMKEFWEGVFDRSRGLKEIRLRGGMPMIINTEDGEFFVSGDGTVTNDKKKAAVMDERELESILQHMCRYSPYAYEDEIRQGFLIAAGGFRIGIAGQVVRDETGRIRTIKYIHSLNIRIPHEIKGTADPLMPFLYERSGKEIKNTLIVSLPGCGKTTLLRDMIRQLSDGNERYPGMTVGVVDERSEIAGTYMGMPRNDVGIRTDVMDACPKEKGIQMLVRSMAPQVIAVDEIGDKNDFRAVMDAMACGCSVLATMHGRDAENAFLKYGLKEEDAAKFFDLVVVMDRFGKKPGIAWISDRGEKYVTSDGRNFDHGGNLGIGNVLQKKNV